MAKDGRRILMEKIVNELHVLGYSDANLGNVFANPVYREFMQDYLKLSRGQGFDREIDDLTARLPKRKK